MAPASRVRCRVVSRACFGSWVRLATPRVPLAAFTEGDAIIGFAKGGE